MGRYRWDEQRAVLIDVLDHHLGVAGIRQNDQSQTQNGGSLLGVVTISMKHGDGYQDGGFTDETGHERFERPRETLVKATVAVEVGDHHPFGFPGCAARKC